MSKFKVKGFPSEISDYIELPNMAELLMYNQFFDISAEAVMKYGSDFHRHLLNRTPLRNDKKHVSVMSQIRIMLPSMRSCTRCDDDPNNEWHIDCELSEKNLKNHVYHRPTDRIHLLSNEVTCPTEFLEKDIEVDFDHDQPYSDFIKWFKKEKIHLLSPKSMPSNKIVTFDSNLHRATNPKQIEFRYMFRVVETDRERPPDHEMNEFQNAVKAFNGSRNSYFEHLRREKGRITINFPAVTGDVFKKYNI